MVSQRGLVAESAGLMKKIGDLKTISDYGNKQSIFAQGAAADAMFHVDSGSVKMTVVSQGKKATIAILQRGEFFGEGCLAKGSLWASTATSLHRSTITRVRRETFNRLIRRDAAFSNLFVSYLVSRVGRMEEDYADHVLNPSERRLARVLWSLTGHGTGAGPAHSLKISQGTLAEMIGTTRPRVSYFMNRFRKMGLINYNGSLTARPALHAFLLNGKRPAN